MRSSTAANAPDSKSGEVRAALTSSASLFKDGGCYMYRNRAYRRYMNYIKAKRKKDIDTAISWGGYLYYNNLHQYSKGKIHCSCPMCRLKTKSKGRHKRGLIGPSYNPPMKDRRKNDSMNEDLKEN